MKNGNGNAITVLMALAIAFVMATPVSAALGGQSFPNVDFDDNNVTNEEIEIAQSAFPDPGVLPSSPFYFLKRFAEDVRMTFTFNRDDKAKLHLERAKTRLAETQQLVEENKPEEAKSTAEEFAREVSSVKENTNDVSVVQEHDEVTRNGMIVLDVVSQRVSETDRPSIERSIDQSTRGFISEKRAEDLRQKFRELRERREEREGKMCAQIVTNARNLETGEVKEFSTPCDVPTGWEKVDNSIPTWAEARWPNQIGVDNARSDEGPDITASNVG